LTLALLLAQITTCEEIIATILFYFFAGLVTLELECNFSLTQDQIDSKSNGKKDDSV
jgi:hypothetical protein